MWIITFQDGRFGNSTRSIQIELPTYETVVEFLRAKQPVTILRIEFRPT